MNVVVCGKVIPASTVTIEIDPNTKRMVRKGVPHELDPAAASAVEEGLRLTEKHGGTVTLVTMGISDAPSAFAMLWRWARLRRCIFWMMPWPVPIRSARQNFWPLPSRNKNSIWSFARRKAATVIPASCPGRSLYFLGVPPVTFAKEITVDGSKITIKRQSETRLRRRRVDVARVGSLQQRYQRTALSAAQRHHGGEEKRDQSLQCCGSRFIAG